MKVTELREQITSFLALMQNYDKEQQYEQDELNAQGSAWQKYQEYLKSTEAKVNSFKTSLHDLYADMINSDAINAVVSKGQDFVQFLDYVITKSPLAGAKVVALSGIFVKLAHDVLSSKDS